MLEREGKVFPEGAPFHRIRVSRIAGSVPVAVVVVVVSLGLTLLAVSSFGSDVGVAGGPKIVQGYVYDLGGYPVQGASVTVELLRSDTLLWSETYPGSDSDGFYTITVDPFAWMLGDTLKSTATYGEYTNSVSVIANSDPIQDVDITLAFDIPEFAVGFGLIATVGAMSLLGVFAGARRRRRQ